jgi:drug/metabolite transporter (DMT)-like permease
MAYAVGNARCLKRLKHISAHDWSLLTGFVSVGVAVLASIAGNALWNRMSRLLPLTLIGQMILFETLFALIYGFLWEHRLPTILELAALVLVVMSVFSCLAAHRGPASSQKLAPTAD